MTGEGDLGVRRPGVVVRAVLTAGRLLGITSDVERVRMLSRRWMPLGSRVVVVGGGLVGTELAEFLFRAQPFPDGAILSTGTCLVPALDAPVVDGDVVTISIDGIGQITNVVTPTSQLLS